MENLSITSSIILFLFLALFFCFICREIKKKFKIPVTLCLIATGVLYRVIAPHIGHLNQTVDLMKGISSKVIAYGIFPIVIFQGAMLTNWYLMKKQLVQIIILSTTHAMLSAFLNAVAIKFLLGFDFSWNEVLLLGVVLSSTEHIAGIINELKMPASLKTLLIGETMWNDATVLVLFNVLLDTSAGVSSLAETLGTFLRLFLGGLILGLFVGFLVGVIMKRMLNELLLETNIMLASAYLLVLVCEGTVLKFSGGLALVAYGLYISAYGKTIISLEIEERLMLVFQIGARNAECLIYMISGILVADIAIFEANGLGTYEYFALIIFFPLNYLIRALSLLLHYPILKCTGYGINWKAFVCITCTGIKGIISNFLAILILSSDSLTNKDFKNFAAYMSIGTAGLTLGLGGLIMKSVVSLLGYEKMDDVQESLLIGVTKALVEESENKMDDISLNKNLKLINWDTVIEISGPVTLINSILKSSKLGRQLLANNPHESPKDLIKSFASKFTISKHSLRIEMRRRYLSTLRQLYLSTFKSGMCHGDTSLLLIDSCNMSLDKDNETMEDWKIVYKSIYNEESIKNFSRFSKMFLLGRVFRKLLYKRIILAYDCTQTFIKCHKETEELMDKVEIDIDKDVFEQVVREGNLQVEKAKDFLRNYILDCYPEVLADVQTKRSSNYLLYSQKKMIEKIYKQGLLKEDEFETLFQSIEASLRTITFQGFPSMPNLKDIIINRFSAADINEINFLLSKIKEIKADPLTIIFKENEPADGAFFIIRGRVHEVSSWVDQELIIGNIVGVQHLLEEFSQTYTSTAMAITYCILAHIPKEVITSDGFLLDLYKEATEEILLLNREVYGLQDIEAKYIIRVVSSSKIEAFKAGKKSAFPNGAIVIKGQPFTKNAKKFIKPGNKIRESEMDSILLIMPDDFILSYSKYCSLGKSFVNFCVKFNAVLRIGTKDVEVEDLNMTEMKMDDSLLAKKSSEVKNSVTFKKRVVAPVNGFNDNIIDTEKNLL